MGNMFLHSLAPPLAMSAGGVIIRLIGVGFLVACVVVYASDKLGERREADSLGDRVRSTGRIVNQVGDAVLYADPPRFGAINRQLGSVRTWPLTPESKASVEAAGSVSVTRGRDLAAKAIGGAIVPGGVFIFGNAKDRVHDNRELYLIVESPEWAYTLAVDPALGVGARRFAQNLNLAARELAAGGES
jgi:hypothetical protein